jgi:NitT/TauT family transport system ATP-binding protein
MNGRVAYERAVDTISARPAANRRPYVEVSGVGKTYRRGGRDTHALERIDLSIREGEFLAIVGPSGCGKSTLLRLVAGLLLASSGEVRVDDNIVDRPQTNLGIVFQSPVLLDWRTALDNVLMQVELRSLDPHTYRNKALQLLDQIGLADFADRYPYELSGGMRQRVAIARALIHDAPLLLMDEPFGALDALTRETLQQELGRLCGEGEHPVTTVMITNSVEEAILLSDRIVPIIPGPPATLGTPIPVELSRPRSLAQLAHDEQATQVRAHVVSTLTASVRGRTISSSGHPTVPDASLVTPAEEIR